MSYRTSTDTQRCEFCGGSDMHTLGCWTQREVKPRQCGFENANGKCHRDAVAASRTGSCDVHELED